MHKKVPAGEFIRSMEPIAVLGAVNQITFDEDEEKEYVIPTFVASSVLPTSRWLKMAVTTPDVKANCDDLKVLGKGDFKALLKWRIILREEVLIHIYPSIEVDPYFSQIGLDLKEKNTENDTEHTEVAEVVDEEQQISEEVRHPKLTRHAVTDKPLARATYH